MSYKALLFCPEEKTARTVTQVLSELDFQVEPCSEPFAAVKKLTAEHFDAVVVDCENEQNATLLFKSTRNSTANQASLSIAVVEGQAGVAKAFRIGANLVLTKPINVEQSKGTIRVARGLLRKSEAPKPAAAPCPSSEQKSTLRPAPQTTSPTSMFELEKEPEVKPEPTEAALLDSMKDPLSAPSETLTPSPQPNPWQPISKPMAAALRTASEATGSAPQPQASSSNFGSMSSSFGAAAAPAPVKHTPEPEEEFELPGIPAGPASSQPLFTQSAADASKKKFLIAAVVLIAAAAVGYMGWRKTHATSSAAPAKPAVQSEAQPPQVPAASTPENITTASPTTPSATTTSSLPGLPEKVAAEPATKSKKPSTSTGSETKSSPAPTKVVAEEEEPEAIVVKNSSAPTSRPAAPQQVAEVAAPGLLGVSSGTSNTVPGFVDMPTAVPHAAPQTLKVSQGVSQGLLVKKVPPVYPAQAQEMKIQGAVQIAATIGKDGNITNLKLLSGDAILGRAAIDAVKQWKYKPYYLDGQAVDIQTQITINFKLP